MKRLVFLLVSIILIAGTGVMAQRTAKSQKQTLVVDKKDAQKVHEKADKMAKELKLTPAEKANVTRVLLKEKAAKEEIKADNKLTDEEKKTYLKAAKELKKAQLKAVLGEKRYELYKEMKEHEKD